MVRPVWIAGFAKVSDGLNNFGISRPILYKDLLSKSILLRKEGLDFRHKTFEIQYALGMTTTTTTDRWWKWPDDGRRRPGQHILCRLYSCLFVRCQIEEKKKDGGSRILSLFLSENYNFYWQMGVALDNNRLDTIKYRGQGTGCCSLELFAYTSVLIHF